MRFWNCRWAAFVLIVLAAFSQATPANAESPGTEGRFVPGRVIVKPKPHTAAANMVSSLGSQEVQLAQEIPQLGYAVLSVPEGKELEWVQRLAGNPFIDKVQPEYTYSVFKEPRDYFYTRMNGLGTYYYQWNLRDVNAPAAWDISTGSPNFVIAILDTGVDGRHGDLKGKVLSSIDYIGEDNPFDGLGYHGTHVAGIAAARTNNTDDVMFGGVAGMSWDATLMDVKIANHFGKAPDASASLGVVYAADNGAKIINLSFGGEDRSDILQDAINYAYNKGALVVAASGNCADPETYRDNDCKTVNPPIYPAADDNVLAVGAINQKRERAVFSEHGGYVAVVAPGEEIISLVPNQMFATTKGTSQAAPHVSALANLIWAVNPNLTNAQVTNIITSTVRDLGSPGRDDQYGFGLMDAGAALAKAQMAMSPSIIGFFAAVTDTRTMTGTLRVSSLVNPYNWSASVSSSATWLSVDPPSGVAPANLNISINKGSMPAGRYDASITVQVDGVTGASYTVPVHLLVSDRVYWTFAPTLTRSSAAGW